MIAGNQLRSRVNRRRNHRHAGHFALDRFEIFDGQRVGAAVAGAAAHAADVLRAGANEKQIGADAFDLRLDRSLRSLPDADHRDHRATRR